jgi:hypothetical protein
VNRIILGGQIVAIVGLWVLGKVFKERRRLALLPALARRGRMLSRLRLA